MPSDFSKANWGDVLDEMRVILIHLAKQRKTVSYSALCGMITVAHIHHRAPYFHKLLDDLSTQDALDGMPSLAALVVRKDSGIPGQGYFSIFASEGVNMTDPEAYWREQFEAVCDYWSDNV